MTKDADGLMLLYALDQAHECARRGDLERAESIANDVRSRVSIEEHPRLAIRIMLLEGIVHAYQCDWSRSADRLNRARLLSEVHRLKGEEIVAVAWGAYVDFNANFLEQAARKAVFVLKEHEADPFSVCRAGLVLAATYQYVGNDEHADRWFSISRRAAEETGDSSQTSAVIFDIVAMRVAMERFRRTFGSGGYRDLTLELLFAQSSENFDRMGGVRVIPGLHLLLQAQILNMSEDYPRALSVITPIMDELEDFGTELRSQLFLEWLWAHSNCDGADAFDFEIDVVERYIESFQSDDDIAVEYFRFSKIMAKRGDSGRAKAYEVKSEVARDRYIHWRRVFGTQLDGIVGVLFEVRSGFAKAGV